MHKVFNKSLCISLKRPLVLVGYFASVKINSQNLTEKKIVYYHSLTLSYFRSWQWLSSFRNVWGCGT